MPPTVTPPLQPTEARPRPRIVVVAAAPDLAPRAAEAAATLGLPLATTAAEGDLALVLDAAGWGLLDPAPGAPGAVRCELTGGAFGARLRRGVGLDERLAKAMGLRAGRPRPRVLDATAGLGRDSVLAAALGCEVTACERDPVVAWLLRDGLARAAAEPALAPLVARITLHAADAREVMAALPEAERPEVVIVDPMFPERRKTAAVKKEMQALHRLLGAEPDPASLLDAALRCATARVVVKRPGHAPPIEGPRPDLAIPGKAVRFDVYLVRP